MDETRITELEFRVARLEKDLELVLRHLDMYLPPEQLDSLDEQIATLLRQDRKVEAIALYRKARHVELREAKLVVDELEKRLKGT